jgi:glutamate 5-kinase
VLLTEEDFAEPHRFESLRRTLAKLLELGSLPVINENDTVSTAELLPLEPRARRRVNFGDNDRLSALVASGMKADLLLILTDVAGFHTADPRHGSAAQLIPIVESVTPALRRLAGGAGSGRGGMRTKLEAATIASRSGCATVVASGLEPRVIERLFAGEELGTFFAPRRRPGHGR